MARPQSRLTQLVFICTLAALVGCGQEQDDYREMAAQPRRDRLSRLSPEERRQVAPNDLTAAAIEGDLPAVREALARDPSQLTVSAPQTGDTPLAAALRFREEAVAKELLGRMPLTRLFDQNKRGEGYVLLAAQAGFPDVIRTLGRLYYDSLGMIAEAPRFFVVDSYDFSRLDMPDHRGQKALMVAAHRNVAIALEEMYYYGWFERPYYAFKHHTDNEQRNFFHVHALAGREDVLRWGVEGLCPAHDEQAHEGFFRSVGHFFYRNYWRTRRFFEAQVGELGWYGDLLLNRADMYGKTPLHLAIESRSLPAVRALTACNYLNYYSPDEKGNLALQELFLHIPADIERVQGAELNIFRQLLQYETKYHMFTRRTAYWRHRNKEGQTVLHMAARLSDPSFYQALVDIGANPSITNTQGYTAAQVFRQRREELARYARR